MANERIICCCGASTWTNVIAWLDIACYSLGIIICASLFGVIAIRSDLLDTHNKNIANAIVGVMLVMAIFGLAMGIILLKGSNEKRVGFLVAWLVYDSVTAVMSIIIIFFNILNPKDSIGAALAISIVKMSFNAFFFAVVFIRIKEIREGVSMAS